MTLQLFKSGFIILLFSLPGVKVFAEVRLPAILGNHMVLPQNREFNLWGWAVPSENIQVNVGWDTATYRAVANFRTGKWALKIKTPAAGGPFEITVAGDNKIILQDVLIGEVWLCGGQSNMELSANGGIKQAQQESKNATNSGIHFFYVPKSAADYPQDDTKGKWVVCNPEEMQKFSAVGYFFGKRLQEQLTIIKYNAYMSIYKRGVL